MFQIIGRDFKHTLKTYEWLKLFEALCRGQRESYTVIYPDGTKLECKFTNDKSL